MNHKVITKMLLTALSLLGSVASASTRYVDGVNGSDMNNCLSSESACKTIGHAVSLASSGDSIMVAAATYSENLTIGTSLTLIGSSAATTIIDGGGRGAVVAVSRHRPMSLCHSSRSTMATPGTEAESLMLER